MGKEVRNREDALQLSKQLYKLFLNISKVWSLDNMRILVNINTTTTYITKVERVIMGSRSRNMRELHLYIIIRY